MKVNRKKNVFGNLKNLVKFGVWVKWGKFLFKFKSFALFH